MNEIKIYENGVEPIFPITPKKVYRENMVTGEKERVYCILKNTETAFLQEYYINFGFTDIGINQARIIDSGGITLVPSKYYSDSEGILSRVISTGSIPPGVTYYPTYGLTGYWGEEWSFNLDAISDLEISGNYNGKSYSFKFGDYFNFSSSPEKLILSKDNVDKNLDLLLGITKKSKTTQLAYYSSSSSNIGSTVKRYLEGGLWQVVSSIKTGKSIIEGYQEYYPEIKTISFAYGESLSFYVSNAYTKESEVYIEISSVPTTEAIAGSYVSYGYTANIDLSILTSQALVNLVQNQ